MQVIAEEGSFNILAELKRGFVIAESYQSEVASFCISPTSMIPRPCNHKAAALRIALLSVTPDLPRSPWIFLVPEAGNVQIGNRRVV